MAEERLNIILTLTDRATSALRAVSARFARFSRGITNRVKNIGRTFLNLRSLIIGSIAGAAVIGAYRKAIEAASELQEITGKFNVVFRGVEERAEEMSEQLVSSFGLSETASRGFLASLQDTFVPLGFARDRAAEMSGTLVRLAADVGSFNNVATGDVVRDFQSALVGNTETVRKYGIVITEAGLKQEALNQGLDPKNITEQEKAQLRLTIILRGTTDAQGDFNRTQLSFANVSRVAQNRLEDLQASMGKAIVENSTLRAIVIEVSKRLEGLADSFKSGKSSIVSFLPSFETVITVARNLAKAFIVVKTGILNAFDLLRANAKLFSAGIRSSIEGAIKVFVLFRIQVAKIVASASENLSSLANKAAELSEHLPGDPFVESLRDMENSLLAVSIRAEETADNLKRDLEERSVQSGLRLRDAITGVGDAFEGARERTIQATVAIREIDDQLLKFKTDVEETADRIREQEAASEGAALATDELAGAVGRAGDEMERLRKAIPVDEEIKFLQESLKLQEAQLEAARLAGDQIAIEKNLIDVATERFQLRFTQLQKLNAFERAGVDATVAGERLRQQALQEVQDEEEKRREDAAQRARDRLGVLANTTDQVGKAAQSSLTSSFTTAFDTVTKGAELTRDSLKGIFFDMLGAIRQVVLKLAAQKLVASIFSAALPGVGPQAKTFHGGGPVPRFQSGGVVPALLESGEFVVRREVAQPNMGFLKELNRTGVGQQQMPNIEIVNVLDQSIIDARISENTETIINAMNADILMNGQTRRNIQRFA